MTLTTSLSAADRARVSEAVAAAERKTAGEIVTIITDRSSDYSDFALLWSALAAFAALLALAIAPDFYLRIYHAIVDGWTDNLGPRQYFEIAAFVALLKFLGMWLIQLWQPLRLFLVPGPVKRARVRRRAVTCFKVGAERRTHGRTGVLIYLSMREHRADIVADEAITSKVQDAVWGDAMAAMLTHIGEGRVADGLIAGIEQVGVILAEHFPRHENDINELPDRLIEV